MVSVDTVSRIMQAADRWDTPASQLKAHCLAYVIEHYEAVVHSAAFEELTSSPHLLLAVTREAAKLIAPPLRMPSWESDSRPPKRRRST